MTPPREDQISPAHRIAFVGGTGPEGQGLALRTALAGHLAIIGSRAQDRAQAIAKHLCERVPTGGIVGFSNQEAVKRCDLAVLTIPYAAIPETVATVRSSVGTKIVVSAIAPIEFHDGRLVSLETEGGSAAAEVQRLLPDARVVSAFQTIDASRLQDPDSRLDTDVIVCSDDKEARDQIITLAGTLPGIRALSGGRLANSRYVEECTALLITLNRIYKSHSGIRFTGIDR